MIKKSNYRFIGRRLGIALIGVFLSLALLMIVFGVYVFIFSSDELLPYFAMFALYTSLIPLFLAILITLFLKKSMSKK